MKLRLPVSLKEVASGAMLLATLFVLGFLIFVVAKKPVPYEYLQDTLTYSGTTLCPGEYLKYEVDLKVNQTPVTIWRTEMWYSQAPSFQNKWADNPRNFEYFNWDREVRGKLHVANTVKFPVENLNGGKMGPGKYRYIVNLNTSGLSTPTSITIPVEVPETCFK